MLDGGHIGTVEFTHLHFNPDTGGIIPCIKTTIEGHALGTFELFDAGWRASPDAVTPSLKLSSEMLEGGVIGAVQLDVNRLDQDLIVRVGAHTYRLVDGALIEEVAETR